MANPLIIHIDDDSESSDLSFVMDTEMSQSALNALMSDPDDRGENHKALQTMYDRTLNHGYFKFIRTSEDIPPRSRLLSLTLAKDEASIRDRLALWRRTTKELDALMTETTSRWETLMPDDTKPAQTVFVRGRAPASKAGRSILLSAYSYWLMDKVLSASQDHMAWTKDMLDSTNIGWIRSKKEHERVRRETEDKLDQEWEAAHTPTKIFWNAVSYPFSSVARRLSSGSQEVNAIDNGESRDSDVDPVRQAAQAVEKAKGLYDSVRKVYFGLHNRDESMQCADLAQTVSLIESAEKLSKARKGFTGFLQRLKTEKPQDGYIKDFLERVSREEARCAMDLQIFKAKTEKLLGERSANPDYWISRGEPVSGSSQADYDLSQPLPQLYLPQLYNREVGYVPNKETDETDGESLVDSEDGDHANEEKAVKAAKGEGMNLNSWYLTDDEDKRLSAEGWHQVEKREKWRDAVSEMTSDLKKADERLGKRIGSDTRYSRRSRTSSQEPPSPGQRSVRKKSNSKTVDPDWRDKLPLPPLSTLIPTSTLLEGFIDAPPPDVNRWGKIADPSWADISADSTHEAGEYSSPNLQQLEPRPESHQVTRWLAEARLAALYQDDSQTAADQAYDRSLVAHMKGVLEPRIAKEVTLNPKVPYYERVISTLPTVSGAHDDLAIGKDQPSFPSSAGLRGARRYSLIDADSLSPAVQWAVRQAESAKEKVEEEEQAQIRSEALSTRLKKGKQGRNRKSRLVPGLVVSPPN